MPSVTGKEVDELQVSTDGTTGNYQELKTDVIDTFTYNKGRVLEDRTRGGDVTRRYDELKPNPSLEINYDNNDDADASWGVVMLGTGGPRAFTAKVGAARVTGIGNIEGPTWIYNSQTGVSQIRVTIRPVGSAWAETRDTG